MTHEEDTRKAALTQQVRTILKKQLDAGAAKMSATYVDQFFRRVPIEDLVLMDPQTLAAMVAGQLELMKKRQPGEIVVRVFNPRAETDGWESAHTIIEMVNEDTPFLVDSASLTLSEMDLGIHLIIHPVIRVGRDAKGQLTEIYGHKSKSGNPESVMQFQIDRRASEDDLEAIRLRLEAAFTDVHWAVEDWRKMEERAAETSEKLFDWGSKVDETWMNEYKAFLDWLQDDYFVFLGARD